MMEADLAHLGYQATAVDSVEKWGSERDRASTIGKNALIWTGASRGQLGIDIALLRKKTGLEPIQLAIDGGSFVPVLKDLADDPKITGTVIVDYQAEYLYKFALHEYGPSEQWEHYYASQQPLHRSDNLLLRFEDGISETLHEHLLSYADSSNPFLTLRYRIFPQTASRQYVVTNADRSRMADYGKLSMPTTYYRRAASYIGIKDENASAKDFEQRLRAKLATLQPRDGVTFLESVEYTKQLIDKIEARGGKVIFVEMPVSGLIAEAEERLYPRAQFLEVFERITGKTVLVSNETPMLKDFICPDGSHLDMRDRSQFTAKLIDALGLAKHPQ